jgi:hypothetical protein
MRRLGWIAVVALAGMAGGCTDESALYTTSKYVRGYTPPGSSSTALAYDTERDRNRSAGWRER